MTQNEQYWIDRANRRMDNYTLSAIEQARIIQRSYNEMLNYVESEIAKILRHTGGPDTLAYEYRIKRLNVLLAKTEARMQELYGVNLIGTTEFLKRIIPEAYYHTIFDIAQGVGLEPTFSAVPTRLIDKIINENWSGENYSKRIWSNTNKLAGNLRQVLTEAAMTGESIQKTSRKLSEAFATTNYNSRRLIRTETTYACNQAEMLSYKELDIDRYEFVATLDTRTSPICQKLDGQIFETKDAKAGTNLPAMHPNCRSTTIPYFEDGMPTVRAARDENGKRIKVPASMTYDEWYDKYIKPTEGEKSPQKPSSPSKGKDTTPSRTMPQKPQQAPIIEIPAPSVGVPEYTDIPVPEKPLSIFEEAEQNRKEIDKTLHDVEEMRRSLDYEVGTIIDRKGNIVEVINGSEHSVAVDDGALKDLIFTHNHPSGGCFSDNDIINMIDDELLELRASTPQGTYHSLLRTSKASKESSTELVKGFKKANSIVTATKQVQEDLKKGIITKQEAKDKGFNLYIEYMSKSGERFLTENAEKYGYIYTKGVI